MSESKELDLNKCEWTECRHCLTHYRGEHYCKGMDPPPLCNWCGLTTGIGENSDIPAGLLKANVRGGWDSTPCNGFGALQDCTSYSFSLCEFCLDELFCRFQIPPGVDSFDGPEEFMSATKNVELFPSSSEEAKQRWSKIFFEERDKRAAARNGTKK